jgi:Zn finger protein HypA/HybF involved in hydrogenase expression
VGDPLATPWQVVVALVAIPIVVSALLGAVTFRRIARLVFHCRRCDRDFQRPPHRAFPVICPLCRARDWNA